MYQSGGLWSSLTLAENVALPLEEYTDLGPDEIREIAAFKLALVGLNGFEDYYPSQISGGMQKRLGLARAIALDPEVLFFDEPSAGLDPINSRRLDDLILTVRDSLGTTVVAVTHELPSIFAIGNNSIFLDAETKTAIAGGDPIRRLNIGGGPIQWTPDGRSLAYLSQDTPSNIWVQPLDGGPPRQMTRFQDQRIIAYRWSHDGKRLALARAMDRSDIVLLKGVK